MPFIATPTPYNWNPNTAITAQVLNTQIRDAFRFLASGCACTMTLTTDQNTSTSAVTDIVWDTQVDDSDGIITPPTSEFIFARSGVISVRFTGTYGANTGGTTRQFRLQLNDGTGYVNISGISDGPSTASGQQIAGSLSMDIPILSGYKLKFSAMQDSGTTVPIKGAGKTRVTLTWVGKTTDDSIYDNPPSPTPAPTPPPSTYTQHTKIYAATWSRTFKEDNSTRDGDPDICYQGRYDHQYGNQRSLYGFDSATMVNDLAGASIAVMRFTFHVKHTHYDGGSTLLLGGHHYAALPSSYDMAIGQIITDLQRVTVKQEHTYTINLQPIIADAIVSGQFKGIAIGKAPTSTPFYFLYLNGAGNNYRPTITVVYYK